MSNQVSVMSLDDFLGHKTSDGNGGSFLKWNKRVPPQVDVWLHTRATFVAVWQHGVPKIVERKDETTGEFHEEVWGSSWNCWESESILKRQYFRDKNTGARSTPPSICPVCKLIEEIRTLVESGKLSWVQPVFNFEVGDATDRVLHAGGLYNAYRKDMTREELDELKKHKIYRKEAWKENMMARCSYLFRVVDNDHIEDGVMISMESAGLGDKVKIAIRDRMTSVGIEEGNPILHPYAIRWEHHPDATRIDERYRAVPMLSIAMTPAISRLITESEPPDISNLTRPGNPKLLKAVFERYWCGPDVIDWNKIFGSAEAAFVDSDDDGTDFDYGQNVKEEKSASVLDISTTTTKLDNTGHVTEQEEIFACDKCGKDILGTDSVCKHCGYVYEEVESKPEPPPLRPRRSRKSSVTKSKQNTESGKGDDWASDVVSDIICGDDIPF